MCYPEAHSIPLDWHEYREAGTEFIKASTDPESIRKELNRVYKMSPERRLEKGKKARQWVIDNFSITKVGKEFEKFLDSKIQEKNIYYKDLIKGKVLKTLEVKKLAKGTFNRYMKSIGKLGGQNKVPRLSNNRGFADGLLKNNSTF